MSQGSEKTIFIFEADDSMVISQDIVNPDGKLIAANGQKLTYDLINIMTANHILEISIYEKGEAPLMEEKELTYFDKIQQSPEFKQFSEEYNSTVTNLKGNLNDIVFRNQEINTDTLIQDTNNILTNSRSSLQVFDMLHSLRKNDDLTFVHCVNVSLIASIIGKWLKMGEEDIKLLTIAGLLHDIGKLLIPNEILLKPGKLTDEEFATMKTHVNLGFDKIKNQNLDDRIKEVALLHHEKCDGTGYPFNLKDDKIPLFTKIITIADVYDAMTAARVYRGSMCPFDVIRIMEEDAFSKYDPKILLTFINNVVSSYLHNNVRLSDGREAEVILINNNALSRPSVLCNGEFIDLSKRSDLTIAAIL